QTATNYQALVCVFLFGGNDSNNMVVPYTDYAQYAGVRTSASNVAIAQTDLLQFNAPRVGKAFGFHPSFAPVKSIYDAGKLAVVVPSSGGVRVPGRGCDAVAQARYNALKALLYTGSSNHIVQGAGKVLSDSLASNEVTSPLLSAAAAAMIQTAFSVNGTQRNP